MTRQRQRNLYFICYTPRHIRTYIPMDGPRENFYSVAASLIISGFPWQSGRRHTDTLLLKFWECHVYGRASNVVNGQENRRNGACQNYITSTSNFRWRHVEAEMGEERLSLCAREKQSIESYSITELFLLKMVLSSLMERIYWG